MPNLLLSLIVIISVLVLVLEDVSLVPVGEGLE